MGATLGAWQSSTTATLAFGAIGAGSNRGLVIWVNQEVASPSTLTVTYGDQTATAIGSVAVGDATDNHLAGYFITEAQIVAASGTTITAASAPASTALAARAYQDVEQNTATIQATFASASATGDSDPLSGISAPATAGDVSVGGGGTGNASGGNAAWAGTNPMTHGVTADASSSCITAGDRVSAGSETVNHSVTYTTAPNRVTGAMFVLADNSAAGITSIDSDYGAASDEFDLDEDSLDINGQNFEASQGSGAVYLSDAATLAGSANEVDISAAVNTWADTLVNLDCTALTTEIASLESLDIGARWVILTNNSADEYSIPVTVHRAKAFDLSASGNIAASGANTTFQLAAPAGKTTGDFGGGRIQDDENPADSVDLGIDEYGEWEWAIEGRTPPDGTYLGAQDGETYQFRILVEGSPPDTVSVTPEWTIGGGLTVSTSATMNGGGSLSTSSTSVRSVAVTMNGGGNIAETHTRSYPKTTIVELALDAGDPPYIDQAMVFVRWRVSSSSLTGGANELHVELYEGATYRWEVSLFGPTTSFGLWNAAIPEAYVQSITDWSDLRLRFQFFSEDLDVGEAQIADVWLQVPAGKPTAAGTLNGGGSLSVTVAKAVERTTTVNGGGSIAASVTASEAHTTSAILNGGGSISAVDGGVHDASGVLNGGGSIAASVTATETHTATATVNGGGSIATTQASARATAPTLNGGGSITATATATEAGSTSGVLNGGGSFTPATTGAHVTTAEMNGGGSFIVTANEHHYRTAIMNGGGSIAATPTSTHPTTGTVNGGGSISASATSSEGHSTAGTLNGGGSIAATSAATHQVVAQVRGGGGMGTSTHPAHSAATTMNGGGSIAATAAQGAVHSVAAAINGGGSIAPTIGTIHLSVELQLDVATDPQVDTDHYLNAVAEIATSNEGIYIILWSGSAYITEWTLYGPSSGVGYYGALLLSDPQAAQIGDYTDLWVSVLRIGTGTGVARLVDIWLEIPYYTITASGTINGGGSIAGAVTGTHIPRAFPDLGEGMLGPATNGGGSIAASATQGQAGTVATSMHGGGSITTSVIGNHSLAPTVNGGGSITASVSKAVERTAVMNGGGRILYSKGELTSGTMHGGGSITAIVERGTGTGLSVSVNGGGSITVATDRQHAVAVSMHGGGSIHLARPRRTRGRIQARTARTNVIPRMNTSARARGGPAKVRLTRGTNTANPS